MARPLPHKRAARVAAVSILTFIAVMAGIWLAPRVSVAVAQWLATPSLRMASVSVSQGLTVVAPTPTGSTAALSASSNQKSVVPTTAVTVDAGLQFTMIGVTAKIPSAPGDVNVVLRTSEDRISWSNWYTVPLEMACDSTRARPTAYTEALWTGPGRYVQVAAEPAGSGTTAARLRDVHVVAINSTENADRGALLLGVIRRTAAAIAGIQLVPPAGAMTVRPDIVTRAQWGANESWRRGSPSYATVQMAFVHHTDNGNDYTEAEAPAIVRGIYAYHTKSLGWSDIGYNFLIDRYGTIYEGRYGGVTKGVIGAQVLGFNTGSTGVSIIGTFNDVNPPAAAITSLENLLAWKLDLTHVDPLGTATLSCGYGQKFKTGARVTFPAIAGHRDANYTDCPGNKLYAMLPAIRTAVAAIGQPKIYDLTVGNSFISPNGDGVQDSTSIHFTLSEDATWSVQVCSADGTPVRQMTGTGSSANVTWTGQDDQGQTVADGAYTVVASATNADGQARAATATVHVDTTPPSLLNVTVAPSPFSPNGDGFADRTTLSFLPGESGTASVAVVDSAGTVLRLLSGWHAVSASLQTVAWDGRIYQNGSLVPAPDGEATLQVSLRDLAGNTTTATCTVVVNRTLGFPTVTPRTISPNGDGVDDTAVVGFKLTRRADVTLAIMRGSAVLRSIHAGGALARGPETVAWNGKIAGGAALANGAYTARLTAVGNIGTVSVSVPFTVDCYRPRLTVPATAKATFGKKAKVSYVVRDPYSSTVKVTVRVSRGGASVATVACGWVRQGVGLTLLWKAPARGTYRLRFSALDGGGNVQNAAGVTVLTVR